MRPTFYRFRVSTVIHSIEICLMTDMLGMCAAFMPGPVIYGSVIDTTCILWGNKCGKQTSCHYYDLDLFRQR